MSWEWPSKIFWHFFVLRREDKWRCTVSLLLDVVSMQLFQPSGCGPTRKIKLLVIGIWKAVKKNKTASLWPVVWDLQCGGSHLNCKLLEDSPTEKISSNKQNGLSGSCHCTTVSPMLHFYWIPSILVNCPCKIVLHWLERTVSSTAEILEKS